MPEGWQTVAAFPRPVADELQVWRIDLAQAVGGADYAALLSNDEVGRAQRLRAGEVRTQFVVARACLRVLLGEALGEPPGSVPICFGTHGKPETEPVNGWAIHFNVAHSRETILIALCPAGRVGIDLEYVDRAMDVLEVARASFTEGEFRHIEGIDDPAMRRRAFFQCWSRKEAIVKADGRGLSLALGSFEVPVGEATDSAAVEVPEKAGRQATTWYVSDLALGEDVAAAFAVEIERPRLKTLVFPLCEAEAFRFAGPGRTGSVPPT